MAHWACWYRCELSVVNVKQWWSLRGENCSTLWPQIILSLPLRNTIFRIALYGAETWTLRAVDKKHMESFETWCWRRMEKISWTDRVGNEVLHRVMGERSVIHAIKRRKANWIGHILRRNCLVKKKPTLFKKRYVTGRRGRISKKLLDGLQGKRGCYKLKEETLDRCLWRTCFGGQTAWWKSDKHCLCAY